jgi:hypothetical protein
MSCFQVQHQMHCSLTLCATFAAWVTFGFWFQKWPRGWIVSKSDQLELICVVFDKNCSWKALCIMVWCFAEASEHEHDTSQKMVHWPQQVTESDRKWWQRMSIQTFRLFPIKILKENCFASWHCTIMIMVPCWGITLSWSWCLAEVCTVHCQ